jgi:ABC-type Fe3+ transport system permease subunit
MTRHPGFGVALIGVLIMAGAFWLASTFSREDLEATKATFAVAIGCAWIVTGFGIVWAYLGTSDEADK